MLCYAILLKNKPINKGDSMKSAKQYCPYCELVWEDKKAHECKSLGCGVIPVPDAKTKIYEKLIRTVMDLIDEQIQKGDVTGVEELLTFVPTPFLIGFLDEERWIEFRRLKGVRSRGASALPDSTNCS
jgi:hypothetical protein